MAANPITNGGLYPKPLVCPVYRKYALDNKEHGKQIKQDKLLWSDYLRVCIKCNPHNFRILCPVVTKCNRLTSLL